MIQLTRRRRSEQHVVQSAHTILAAAQGTPNAQIASKLGLNVDHADLLMQPGHVLRREFEYIRYGTLSWFINFDVATGQVIEPSWGPTRREQDCLAHLKRLVESAPAVKRWHLMVDNLDARCSESVVRWVADLEGIEPETLGKKGKSGSLRASRGVLPPKAYFLDETGGYLALDSGAQAAQTRQFHLA